MKILVLHSSSDLYGASKILLQTVIHLSANGHNVTVILSEDGPLSDALCARNISVHILKLGILRRKYLNLKGLINRFRTIRNASREIGVLVDQLHIDVIYSNTTGVLVGAFVAKNKKVRHIWHIHEIIIKPKWFLKILGWLVNRYSDKVIVVSSAVMKHWQKFVNRSRICLLYNGLDYGSFLDSKTTLRTELNVSEDDVLIGMIGRVHYWKGQNYFLKIARPLCDKHDNLKFIMVGDAFPGYEYLYDEIKSTRSLMRIDDKVIDLGFRTDIPDILHALDIFVLPSILPDPLPTVVLEAMASGKPVVATAHGGAVEMVDEGVSGVLIPWDNEMKAASCIEPLITNKELRLQMGARGQKKVIEHFSQSAFLSKIEKIITGYN